MSNKIQKLYYFEIDKCRLVDYEVYDLLLRKDYRNYQKFIILNETVYNALKTHFSRIDLQLKLDI